MVFIHKKWVLLLLNTQHMSINNEKNPKKRFSLYRFSNRHMSYLQRESPAASSSRKIPEIFTVGNYYYYTLHLHDSTLSTQHENLIAMHGFIDPPKYLADLLELIHPDDINFMQEAELLKAAKIREIGWEHASELKSGYCCRLRLASGAYEMFHHQAVYTRTSEEGHPLEALHINTHIQHLMPINSYQIIVSGIGGRTDFHLMQWGGQEVSNANPGGLSKREIEIIALLAKGLNTTDISEKLSISSHTVRTHRKNILDKTRCRNSSELIFRAFEQGYL